MNAFGNRHNCSADNAVTQLRPSVRISGYFLQQVISHPTATSPQAIAEEQTRQQVLLSATSTLPSPSPLFALAPTRRLSRQGGVSDLFVRPISSLKKKIKALCVFKSSTPGTTAPRATEERTGTSRPGDVYGAGSNEAK